MPRALGALLLVALIECNPGGNAPESTTTVLTVSPSPSVTRSVLDARFGYLVGDGHGFSVRSETDPTAIMSFTPEGRSWTSLSNTVSPDGTQIAYWAPVMNGATLHVRGASSGPDRRVFTAATDLSGNAFTWSSDVSGLVVAIDNGCQEVCIGQGGKAIEELWTIDLASGASERVASGKFWLPVAWDRSAKLIAAGVTGPGGYLVGYDVIDLSQKPYVVRSTEFRPPIPARLKASSDARFVLLTSATPAALSWWPLDAPQKRAEIRTFDGETSEWRPGTSETGGATRRDSSRSTSS